MIDISRESEINLINILIDQDIISGKDLIDIKKTSSEGNKSQLDAVFELKLTDEEKILDLLVKEQSLQVVDLKINSDVSSFKSSVSAGLELLINKDIIYGLESSDLENIRQLGITTVINCAVNLDINYVSKENSTYEKGKIG